MQTVCDDPYVNYLVDKHFDPWNTDPYNEDLELQNIRAVLESQGFILSMRKDASEL